jgi:uncharacterized protein (DUF1697 family)
MPRVHLIRAVNVGGAKLPMAELREIAVELGATDVSTFIASGNLLCDPPGKPVDFDRALELAIQRRYGYFREVISRSRAQVQKALRAYPFEVSDLRFSHIYFLTAKPTAPAVKALGERDLGHDEAQVIGQDLHLRYGGGVHETKLTSPVIAKVLGVQGTGRNIQTVAKLVELAGS